MAQVLIIDDDVNVTALLEKHLTEQGFDVSVAHNGTDGMAQAVKSGPDLIMLDVILPDATGFQLCSQFRKATETKTVPIIMMTGVARFPNQRTFALERGASEYILKPFKIFEVGDMVRRYIGTKHLSVPVTPSPNSPPPHLPPRVDAEPVEPGGPLDQLCSFFKEALHRTGIHR